MGPFANLTKGFNYVKSTLKGAYNSSAAGQFRSGLRMGAGSMSGAAGIRSMQGAKSYGQGMAGRWQHSTGMQKAGMAGAYGGAAAGGYAAADFLNPWGLGWAD